MTGKGLVFLMLIIGTMFLQSECESVDRKCMILCMENSMGLCTWFVPWNICAFYSVLIGRDGKKGQRNLVPCYPERNCRGNQFVTRFCCQSGGKSYMGGNWGPTCKNW